MYKCLLLSFLISLLLPQPLLADCNDEDGVDLRVRVVDEEEDEDEQERAYSWAPKSINCPPDNREPFSQFEEPVQRPPAIGTVHPWYLEYLEQKRGKEVEEQLPQQEPQETDASSKLFQTSLKWYHALIVGLVVVIVTLILLHLRDYRKYHWKRHWLD